ncbi:two-component sensor histidine kinase [Caulobacter ginsengisoli]|uniref:histidine kinase n=1 Tax=Caulobacter ginsengisoli TaxID=400775 RepID=A0ABU0IQ66_9CAUL|nr:histidine kinase dimerization/phosphoacceptor domain -containing protein [Caulobacter ginsengisoli]MDQ0463516.1 two-component sensor histidine kinase [Caulobacter ginsengisoli]
MAARPPTHPDVSLNLALAVVASSSAPILLLDGNFAVVSASDSFCRTFQLAADKVIGRRIFALGDGEWDIRQLHSLLSATASGVAKVDAYEMDLQPAGKPLRRLVLNAHKLEYGNADQVRLLLTVLDVTQARIAEKLKDDLLREKAILLQEVQHRVANSLQIISSVILQSARRARSEDVRAHLHDAHDRVMSVAEVQKQLATSTLGDVELGPYFKQLCQSLGASMIRDHKKISIEVTADDSAVPADVSISLGLIVTELVINALKHAFPGGRAGKVTVDYHARGPNWTLAVSDNGVGMPADPKATPGLGSSIVEALARQLKGEVHSAPAKPGTTVSIVHRQLGVVEGAEPVGEAV